MGAERDWWGQPLSGGGGDVGMPESGLGALRPREGPGTLGAAGGPVLRPTALVQQPLRPGLPLWPPLATSGHSQYLWLRLWALKRGTESGSCLPPGAYGVGVGSMWQVSGLPGGS